MAYTRCTSEMATDIKKKKQKAIFSQQTYDLCKIVWQTVFKKETKIKQAGSEESANNS